MSIEEIAAREKAATPGPWVPSGAKNDILTAGLDIIACFCDREDDYEADAEFVAHAREDIPYLLAELKEAQEKLERRTQLLRTLLPICGCGDVEHCISCEFSILQGGK